MSLDFLVAAAWPTRSHHGRESRSIRPPAIKFGQFRTVSDIDDSVAGAGGMIAGGFGCHGLATCR
ncbi:hypothetical protein ACFV4F_06620 [Kitasatospora sp. NPDC059722]|uniref:hypothetical protein n=1 Tax=Kitasatospora sp. NPDC059722 TaxID=3346925 RepID=UPI003687939B